MVKNRFDKIIIKSVAIASIFTMMVPGIANASRFTQNVTSRDTSNSNSSSSSTEAQPASSATKSNKDRIIVLDPGHGKSSGSMSDSEKTSEGFVKNGSGWGEWRHWKDGTYGEECHGDGCTHTGSNCWYAIGNGDRDKEPEITLNNATAAKKYLEQMGYTVRMTRTSNSQNPSFTKRASYCFKGNDTSQAPDAELYVCIHSNAGGGAGTAYITTGGTYKQKYIPNDYVTRSNKAGELINNKVAEATGLSKYSGGTIDGEEWLIAFNKNPVPTAYLEIGFFDNASDLAILQSKSDEIGKAIAEGIDEYLQSVEPSVNTGATGSGGSGNSIITSREEKFLGTWKNRKGVYTPYFNSDGSINEDALFDPEGIVVKYREKKTSFWATNPAGAYVSSNASLLFELLASSERTQQEEQIMRYLLYLYTGIDYGVTEFDFSVFDISSFTKMGTGGGYTFTGADSILWRNNYSKEDFVNYVKNFQVPNASGSASGTSHTNQQGWDTFFSSCADQWYDICTGNGIDPIVMMAIGAHESGYGTSQIAWQKANLWGWGAVNSNPLGGAKTHVDEASTLASAAMALLDDITKSLKQTADDPNTNDRYAIAVSKGAVDPDLSTISGTGAWYCADDNGNITSWDQHVADMMKTIFGDFVAQYCSAGMDLGEIDADTQQVLTEVMATWPNNMEAGRQTLIQKAASLVNKGCKYSQGQRDPSNPNPAYLDCSAYVAWAFNQTGHTDVPVDAYTGTFVSSSSFTAVNESDLIPGDIGLNNSSMAGGNDNHIGIYIGKNASGQNVWLHCTSSGINGPQVRNGNGNFRVFYRYTNW